MTLKFQFVYDMTLRGNLKLRNRDVGDEAFVLMVSRGGGAFYKKRASRSLLLSIYAKLSYVQSSRVYV